MKVASSCMVEDRKGFREKKREREKAQSVRGNRD